jgi:O-antigen/teichoic acid export membrane protein
VRVLLKNLLYLSSAEIVGKVATFAAIATLARIAGPSGFGYIEFAMAVLMCASLVVEQGFGPYGACEIAKTPQQTAIIVSEVVSIRLVLVPIAYLLVIAFAILSRQSAVQVQLLLLYGLSLIGMPLLLQWAFQGHNRMQTVSAIQTIRQIAFAVVVFAFVRTESDIWFAALGEVAGVGLAAAFGVWAYRKQLNGRIQLRLRFSPQLFRAGVPLGLSQMFWMMRMFGATIVIGMIAVSSDVGLFSSALRILIALHTFVWLYFFNLLPSLSQAWSRKDGTFAFLIRRSIHTTAWIGVAGSMIWVLITPALITWIYGSAYASAATTLQWLAGMCLAAILSGHYRYGLIAGEYQTTEMFIQILGTVIALLLIPLGYGIANLEGAAIALVVAEAVVWWASWWWGWRLLELAGHLPLVARPLVAGMVTLCVLWLLPLSSVVAQASLAIFLLLAQAFVFDATIASSVQRAVAGGYPWLQKALDRPSRRMMP